MRKASGHGGAGIRLAAAFAALVLCLALPTAAVGGQGVSCSSFRAQEDAQAVFEANVRNGAGDRFGLDPDGDGIACEDLRTRSGDQPADEGAGPKPSPAAARGTYHFPDPRDADVDGYWQRTFADAGETYTSPSGLLPLGGTAFRSLCTGRLGPVDFAAFYCPADGKIYYDEEIQAWVREEYGEVAWTMVMAHEWGHHVQFVLDPLAGFGADGVAVELQADCLAGAYLADALARDWVDQADLEAALLLALDSGSPKTHGTGSERLEAVMEGLEEGVRSCGVDL